MDRNREARRGASMVASSNGLSRRRHRSNKSLRDSPDEDGAVELQESVRLRERIKKDRDRDREMDRERERDRERDRERERERSSRSSKRRRGERMMIHGNNRDDGGEDSSEESVNDDEDKDEDDTTTNANINGHHSGSGGDGGVRLLPLNPAVAMNSVSNHYHSSNSNSHHHNHHHNIGNNNSSINNINHNHQQQLQQQHQNLQHRKSFPPSSAKVFRAAPVWKSGDEMIGVSVPRKARSASTKRSHDWISNNTVGGNGGSGAAVGGGGGAEQIQQQAESSPARQSLISTSTPSPAAPVSPTSSNASVRKKIKPNGPKQQRPPKSASSKASSSNPEELEIEIAEVLYGLKTQSQAPPKKEILSCDSREVNRSSGDAKSRVSSPISNSPSAVTGNIQPSAVILPPNSISSAGGPLSGVAPKRKRPRQVSEGGYSVRSSPISLTNAKLESDQTAKAEISSPNLEKNPGSAAEGGYDLSNLTTSQPPMGAAAEHQLMEPMKVESEVKAPAEDLGESKDVPEEMVSSLKKESSVVKSEETNREGAATGSGLTSVAKSSLVVPEAGNQMEEKFQIDLEAPPPQLRLSPEREGDVCLGTNQVSIVADDSEIKPIVGKDSQAEKMLKMVKENGTNTVGNEEKKPKSGTEDLEKLKRVENKGRIIDLQLDLEKPERENGSGNKLQSGLKQQPPQPPLKASKEESHTETNGQPNSLPLPMSIASWPGAPPPMGYMGPIQGVVSMDGSTVSPAPIQPFFSQPRPKRCATHCYIARNIHYLQQFMKMSSFWPAAAAAAGSGSLFESKACKISVVPPADLHGSVAGRGANATPDKGPGLSMFPGNSGKDRVSQSANITDANQRKQQILLQPALPPVAPNNILHGPAFIFPLNHQQATVAAASARPASAKPPATASGTAGSGSASNSAAVGASPTPGGAATAVSFNYPNNYTNMPANETQYLAILQNNAYPFPLPAVGAPPNFRGTHPQAMPLFNGSFYASQIIHPSQLQQQQAPPASQPPQIQQGHQNVSLSSGSSSSQKHLQSQQQRPAGNAVGATATGSLHNLPAPKNRPSQQPQPSQNHHILPQVRQLENEVGNDDSSPSTADSRGSRPPVNIYGQHFAMPIHPQNYPLLTPPAALASASASSGNSNQSDKKQQQSRPAGVKNVVESLPAQAFAMSFASINGATAATAIDLSSMAQNHAILQSLPEATRQNIQMMAANAAQVAQQHRKNFRISEDGKTGGDSSNTEDERKGLSVKSSANVGQSIAFTRSDLTDPSGSTPVANTVIDSSARSLNLASGVARSSRPVISGSSIGNVGLPSGAQIQAQHQPQQMMQLPKQQQQYVAVAAAAAAAAAWSKNPVTTNGGVYPEHLSSSASAAAKFPNALSAFPQNLVQSCNNGSSTRSPQWKNSTRAATPQVPNSFASSSTSLKSMQPQQGRNQQSHSQISFGANQKPSAGPQGQPVPGSNQSPASPMMVGSPSTSSISKGASGSPRTTTPASVNSKTGQASSLSGQQAKNSSVPNQKSSPMGGRNVPSILGNPHIAVAASSGPKSQMQQLQQQQQQQQFTKNIQQGQLFFSTPYMQPQPPHSSSSNSTTTTPSGGYYVQRRRGDQQQAPPQQPPGSSPTSTGMLSLSVSLAGASTSDPAKAIAAATAAAGANMKGGGLTSQNIFQAAQSSGNQHQLMPAGFTYVHAVPAGVAVKPAEQKQPAGNDNLHACWQPEKK